ncbi:MAG: hypothetical protein KC503_47215, partial [Myxococcales bacterium]|nr:hypothetical protein [Myxococcales bacterium]
MANVSDQEHRRLRIGVVVDVMMIVLLVANLALLLSALWRACTAEADAGTTLRRRKLDEVFVQPAASRRVARADVTL